MQIVKHKFLLIDKTSFATRTLRQCKNPRIVQSLFLPILLSDFVPSIHKYCISNCDHLSFMCECDSCSYIFFWRSSIPMHRSNYSVSIKSQCRYLRAARECIMHFVKHLCIYYAVFICSVCLVIEFKSNLICHWILVYLCVFQFAPNLSDSRRFFTM